MYTDIARCSSIHVQKPVVVVMCAHILWSTTDVRRQAEETILKYRYLLGVLDVGPSFFLRGACEGVIPQGNIYCAPQER